MTALELSPQYITDDAGNRVSVVLPLTAFQKLLALLEELEDVRLYDDVKNRNEERVLLNDYLAEQAAHA